jgi:diaminohydroxyphosphoribosylaminopyrimidine deaminase/5-amino-6-(5-phosphoribosylamino)uracil reductase
MPLQQDEQFMARCLVLAQRGERSVMPNPMVGAVLVHEDRILAEGYHHYFGGPHAEVDCLNNVSPLDLSLVPESTLYVSLEPCSHFGKTPPCANLILEKKIKRVVVACLDANPLVAGKGLALLQNSGVEVQFGVLEKEARALNKRFFTNHEKQRPYIILKWAQSADGFIATDSQAPIAISNKPTQLLNHLWRSQEAAIAVGVNTVHKDNPSLTTRLVEGTNPARVIYDPKGALDKNTYNIFNEEAVTLHLGKTESLPNWSEVMNYLWQKKKISSVIIEGGSKTLQYFIDNKLWEEVRMITNQKLFLNKGYAAPKFQIPTESRIEHLEACTIRYVERFH